MDRNKEKVLITGGGGLVGSRIIELLSSSYEFMQLSRSNGFDITNEGSFSGLTGTGAKILIHLAAKTDVDGCESEKDLGDKSEAWRINVDGTKNVVNFCKENNIKIIFMSTDFVFDGEKEEGEGYTEEDTPNPINWYAKTKYEGERVVQDSGVDHIILRIAYPYRKEFAEKKDFVRAIVSRLEQNTEVNAITDHIMCPTYIDDVAEAIDGLIKKNESGIFHAVGATPLSPYEASMSIADFFNLDKDLIKPTTREEYFKNKADRPFNLFLRNDKLEIYGIIMKPFSVGLKEIKA